MRQHCRKHNRDFMAECPGCKQEMHDVMHPEYSLAAQRQPKIRRLDHTFHEARNYMTPAMYQGVEILAYIGSCKESGCGNIARHINREGRDRMVWKHRREHILTYRLNFFEAAMDTDGYIEEAMTDHADKHTHTYLEWLEKVRMVFRYQIFGDDLAPHDFEMPEFKYEVYYQVGFNVIDTVKKVADASPAVH